MLQLRLLKCLTPTTELTFGMYSSDTFDMLNLSGGTKVKLCYTYKVAMFINLLPPPPFCPPPPMFINLLPPPPFCPPPPPLKLYCHGYRYLLCPHLNPKHCNLVAPYSSFNSFGPDCFCQARWLCIWPHSFVSPCFSNITKHELFSWNFLDLSWRMVGAYGYVYRAFFYFLRVCVYKKYYVKITRMYGFTSNC